MSKLTTVDVETTGLNLQTDRIVQIAVTLQQKGHEMKEEVFLINPGMPIPKESSDIHNIYDEDVLNAPTLAEVIPQLQEYFSPDVTILTQNGTRFDLPMLVKEFTRVGFQFPMGLPTIDTLKLETKLAPRTLGFMYEKYTGETLEGAHDAMVDVKATNVILKEQTKAFGDIRGLSDLVDLCKGDKDFVDYSQKLYKKDGVVMWNSGKHKDKPLGADKDYNKWVVEKATNFPVDTLNIVKQYL